MMAEGNLDQYFLPRNGIQRVVVTKTEITRYFGSEAIARFGSYEEPQGNVHAGLHLRSDRQSSKAVIGDPQFDSAESDDDRDDSSLWNPKTDRSRYHKPMVRVDDFPHLVRTMPHRKQAMIEEVPLPEKPTPQHKQVIIEEGQVLEQPTPFRKQVTIEDLRSDSARWNPEKRTGDISTGRLPQHVSLGGTYQLPIQEHIIPHRKDLPILLDGVYVRSCADFGAFANIISYKFVQDHRLYFFPWKCELFELPTFGKLLQPMGRINLKCRFPDEPNSESTQTFFVLRNFVHSASVGSCFLRQSQTLDLYSHRMKVRPVANDKAPIVAFMGQKEETLRFWLEGELLTSTPDTGSEINVMSLDFARKRGFKIESDDVNQVRFADRSLQDVEGLVKVPVSFGNGEPPSLLLKLVSLSDTSPESQLAPVADRATGKVDYRGQNPSILAEFHILDGLRVDVIFGEDLLATVNAFICHSTDFKDVISSTSLYPGLGTIGLVSKIGKRVCRMLGKQQAEMQPDPRRERDLEDSRELDRYSIEKARVQQHTEDYKRRADRKNERRRKEYLERCGP